MKKILKNLILPIAVIMILGGFAGQAFAVSPLSVTFSTTPLFNEANFLPGNEIIRTVGVSNSSATTQNVIVEAINATSTGGLGYKLNLIIKEGDTTRYTGTLGAFLSAGEIPLSSLLSGSSTVYSFGVTFVSDAGNNLQNMTLGFDLCVGFSGGDKHCGDTVIGGEEDTGGGTGGDGNVGGGGVIPGSGGGGGSGGIYQLIIFNEKATVVDTTAIITWDTNLLATSQVVYGLASGGLYTLNLIPPNFGYPLFTTEDPTKVINHSMLLTGLVPGQTYLYRVVSRASPPTISYEHQFTIPLLAQTPDNHGLVLGASTGGEGGGSVSGSDSNGNTAGSVLGDSTSNIENTSDSNDSNENMAAALVSGFGNLLTTCNLLSLLILLILYLIWRLWLRRKYEKLGIPEEEIWRRATLFFGGSSLSAILIFAIFQYYCPLPVFIITFVISVCFYIYLKLTAK